jgi:hypothetical protein
MAAIYPARRRVWPFLIANGAFTTLISEMKISEINGF